MCSAFVFVSAVFAAAVPRLAVGAPDKECPIKSCGGAVGSFGVTYTPGEFTCMACDVTTCPDCGYMCDIAQCVGKFFSQECWCRGGNQDMPTAQEMWTLNKGTNKFVEEAGVQKFVCDDDCSGGICDEKGLKCEPRAKACKPWWWCGELPPRINFMQKDSSRSSRARLRSQSLRSESSDSMNARFLTARSAAKARANATLQSVATANEDNVAANYRDLKISAVRYTCGVAALPPKVQDPVSRLWVDRGYVIFEKASCKGASFDQKCYCWDNFKYLQGKDPMTSMMMCDSECSQGSCDGKKCGTEQPPPLPPTEQLPSPPPVLLNTDNIMDVLDARFS